MEQRFLVQMEFYEYGETVRDAKLRIDQKIKDMSEAFDNDTRIVGVFDAPFGERPILIDQVKYQAEACNHEFEDSNESNCCGANIPMYPDMDICGDCHEHCVPQRYCKFCNQPEE